MPYRRFDQEDLILRDVLALDRTKLANERTLLSYARTAIMLLVSGVTLLKLFTYSYLAIVIGWILVAVGITTVVFGGYRFYSTRRTLSRMTGAQDDDAPG